MVEKHAIIQIRAIDRHYGGFLYAYLTRPRPKCMKCIARRRSKYNREIPSKNGQATWIIQRPKSTAVPISDVKIAYIEEADKPMLLNTAVEVAVNVGIRLEFLKFVFSFHYVEK